LERVVHAGACIHKHTNKRTLREGACGAAGWGGSERVCSARQKHKKGRLARNAGLADQ